MQKKSNNAVSKLSLVETEKQTNKYRVEILGVVNLLAEGIVVDALNPNDAVEKAEGVLDRVFARLAEETNEVFWAETKSVNAFVDHLGVAEPHTEVCGNRTKLKKTLQEWVNINIAAGRDRPSIEVETQWATPAITTPSATQKGMVEMVVPPIMKVTSKQEMVHFEDTLENNLTKDFQVLLNTPLLNKDRCSKPTFTQVCEQQGKVAYVDGVPCWVDGEPEAVFTKGEV